jgi:hypothetical protein
MLKAAFRQGKRRFRPVTGSGKSSAASGALLTFDGRTLAA